LQSNTFLYNVLSLQLLVISIVITCFGEIALAEEQLAPSYIPRAVLFSPAEVMAVKISPDSRALAYAEKWLHDALGGSFEAVNSELMKESSVTIQH
jgi:hypothetical protein